MTLEETTRVVLKLHGAYFSKDRIYNSSELESRINLWDMYFKDFTYKVVDRAASEWIANSKEPPQISELLPRCKDLRELERGSIQDADNIKPTWEMTYYARHGELKDEDISPEIRALTDEVIKWLRADPKTRKEWAEEEAKEKNKQYTKSEVLGNVLPYEI